MVTAMVLYEWKVLEGFHLRYHCWDCGAIGLTENRVSIILK